MDDKDVVYKNGPFEKRFGKEKCRVCKSTSQEISPKIFLQCNHNIHTKCLNEVICKTQGEFMNIFTIDKEEIFDELDKNKSHQKMCLTTENISGVIKCPHKDCEELYSILSPIYREYGFPKRIDLMIQFMHYDEKLWFYGCTNIDLIHLTKGSTQRKMLKEFDYVAESDIIFDMEQEPQLSMISRENFTYHAVIKKNISSEIELQIYPSNICIVCMVHNMLQCEEKENTYTHCTISEYIDWILKS